MIHAQCPKKEAFSRMINHFRAMREQLRCIQKTEQEKHAPGTEKILDVFQLPLLLTVKLFLPSCRACRLSEEIQVRLRKIHHLLIALPASLGKDPQAEKDPEAIRTALFLLEEIRLLLREAIFLSDQERIFDHIWEEAVAMRRALTELASLLEKKRSEIIRTAKEHGPCQSYQA